MRALVDVSWPSSNRVWLLCFRSFEASEHEASPPNTPTINPEKHIIEANAVRVLIAGKPDPTRMPELVDLSPNRCTTGTSTMSRLVRQSADETET